jgi:outer membrane protein TolC
MKRSLIRPVILLAFLPAQAWLCAQESAASLTLHEAVALALQNDARLLPAKNEVRIAQIHGDVRTVWENPELRFETGIDVEEDYINPALRLFPPNPWQREADALEAGALTAIAGARQQVAEVTVAAEVDKLYRELQCLAEELRLAVRRIDIRQQRVDLINRQAAAARITSGDTLRARWQLREAQQEERALLREIEQIKGQLAVQIGRPTDSFTLPPPDLTAAGVLDEPDVAVVAALAGRPDHRLLQAELLSVESALRQLDVERKPWFSHVQAGFGDINNEWSLSFAVTLPVFSRSSHELQTVLTEKALRQEAITCSEQAVAIQVQEAARAATLIRDEWNLRRTEQTELAAETQNEIVRLRESTSTKPGEWLDLEEWLVDSELRLLQTLRDLYAARNHLFLMTGRVDRITE